MTTRQSLYHVQFPTSAPVCQVDDFPRGTARSADGALHVRPGGTKKITKTELEHLQKIRPWGRLIRVIKKVTPKPLPSANKDGSPKATAAEPNESEAVKAARAKELEAKAAKTDKGGAKKGGKPKQVAGKDGQPNS